MRFALGEFAHETNTFCPGFTELDAFKSTFWCEGDEIFTRNRGVRNDLGGMIAAGERTPMRVPGPAKRWAQRMCRRARVLPFAWL